MNKGTGNFIEKLSPIYDLPYDPKGGSGIIEVQIFGNFWGMETCRKRLLPYAWSETVNGIEVEIEKPMFYEFEPSALEEDIYNSMKEVMRFDHLNFIQQK